MVSFESNVIASTALPIVLQPYESRRIRIAYRLAQDTISELYGIQCHGLPLQQCRALSREFASQVPYTFSCSVYVGTSCRRLKLHRLDVHYRDYADIYGLVGIF